MALAIRWMVSEVTVATQTRAVLKSLFVARLSVVMVSNKVTRPAMTVM